MYLTTVRTQLQDSENMQALNTISKLDFFADRQPSHRLLVTCTSATDYSWTPTSWRSYYTRDGWLEFAGLENDGQLGEVEIVGLKIDGRSRRVEIAGLENDWLENDGLEFGGL